METTSRKNEGSHRAIMPNLITGALPAVLRDRIEARKNSRVYLVVCALFNIFLIIISGFYFDCYYYTRKYIINGDSFWDFMIKKEISNKAIPLNAMLNGMVCILTFSFNLMNYIVMFLYIQFGGVRDRIIFTSKYIFK